MRPARTLLALAAFALVAAACGSDGDTSEATGDGATEDATTPADGGDTPGEEDAEEVDSSQAAGVPASLEEVLELLRRAESQPQQITYDVEGVGELGTATMILAHDPPRSAMLMEAAEGTFHIISDAERSVTCFSEGGQWQCFAGPAGEDPTEGFLSLPDSADLEVEDGDEPDRIERTTILGLDAICLYFDEQDGATDVMSCFAIDSGAFLRMRGTEAGVAFSMEATAVSAPESRLFEPPAEPIDFQF